jgi:endodeoxyribonuclease RusA
VKNLYIRIVWFARKKSGPDVDNIFKRILDALEGIVYRTDGQIRQCLATKIELAKPYTLSTRHIPEDLYGRLVVLLDSSVSDISLARGVNYLMGLNASQS